MDASKVHSPKLDGPKLYGPKLYGPKLNGSKVRGQKGSGIKVSKQRLLIIGPSTFGSLRGRYKNVVIWTVQFDELAGQNHLTVI